MPIESGGLPWVYHIQGKTITALLSGIGALGSQIDDDGATTQTAAIAKQRFIRGEQSLGGRITSLRGSDGRRYTLKFLIDVDGATLNGEDKNASQATLITVQRWDQLSIE